MKIVPPNILKYAGDVPAFLAVFPKTGPGLPLVSLHRIVQGVRPISKQTLLQLIDALVDAGVLVKSCVDGLSNLLPGQKARVSSVFRATPDSPQIIGLDLGNRMPMGDIVCFESGPLKLAPENTPVVP